MLWGQSLFCAANGGTTNFINGYLDNLDFAATCLYFTGFLFVTILYRLINLKFFQGKDLSIVNVKEGFQGYYVNKETGLVNWSYTMQIFVRTWIMLLAFYCAIKSIHYANLAQVNFGIVSCCYIISIVVNSTVGYFYFKESINMMVMVGMAVTISGIVWISIAKGHGFVTDGTPEISEEQ